MGVAEDLLQQADHLVLYQGVNPAQTSLRRAISTAYYALFHLLIEDASSRWIGSPEARTGLERSFQHSAMKSISKQFKGARWQDWHENWHPVPPELQEVASMFVVLQENRHTADYDNHRPWTVTDVQTTLSATHSAFRSWQSIREDPMAGNYLMAMLVSKQRS